MRKQAAGFMDFVREQGVVGLAVGLAIGAAAGDSVKAIVENFISPIIGFILGGTDLSGIKWEIVKTTAKNPDRELTIGIGAVLNSVIYLLAVAAVIYLLVNMLKLDRLDKKSDKK